MHSPSCIRLIDSAQSFGGKEVRRTKGSNIFLLPKRIFIQLVLRIPVHCDDFLTALLRSGSSVETRIAKASRSLTRPGTVARIQLRTHNPTRRNPTYICMNIIVTEWDASIRIELVEGESRKIKCRIAARDGTNH